MIDIKRILQEISILPELKQQISSKQIMLQTVTGCDDPYFGTGYIYQFAKRGVHIQGDFKDLQNMKRMFEDAKKAEGEEKEKLWQEIYDLDDSICEFIDVKETDFTIPMFPELEYTNSVIEKLGLY
jgi:hypothetical protein